ncbi:hypothetical protein [Longispora urticae]
MAVRGARERWPDLGYAYPTARVATGSDRGVAVRWARERRAALGDAYLTVRIATGSDRVVVRGETHEHQGAGGSATARGPLAPAKHHGPVGA